MLALFSERNCGNVNSGDFSYAFISSGTKLMAENKNENQSYSSLINMKKNPLECLNHIHGFLKNGARGT